MKKKSIFIFNLAVITCDANEVLCNGSKKCIPEAAVCDGVNDCQDLEDELNCPGLCGVLSLNMVVQLSSCYHLDQCPKGAPTQSKFVCQTF